MNCEFMNCESIYLWPAYGTFVFHTGADHGHPRVGIDHEHGEVKIAFITVRKEF